MNANCLQSIIAIQASSNDFVAARHRHHVMSVAFMIDLLH